MFGSNQVNKNGVECTWVFNTGGDHSLSHEDEEEEEMWHSARSSLSDDDEGSAQEEKAEIVPSTPIYKRESEKKAKPSLGQLSLSLSPPPTHKRGKRAERALSLSVTQQEKRSVAPRRGLHKSFYSDRDIQDNVDNAVSSALERARQRHSLMRKQQSGDRESRRSLVKSSVLTMSQRHLDDVSSNVSSRRLSVL